jgi:hypothetical protein
MDYILEPPKTPTSIKGFFLEEDDDSSLAPITEVAARQETSPIRDGDPSWLETGEFEIDYQPPQWYTQGRAETDPPPDNSTTNPPSSDSAAQPDRPKSGRNVLRFIAVLLPGDERSDWVEEQRRYLEDLPRRRARWAWLVAQLLAMPRYAYTVRTSNEAERA